MKASSPASLSVTVWNLWLNVNSQHVSINTQREAVLEGFRHSGTTELSHDNSESSCDENSDDSVDTAEDDTENGADETSTNLTTRNEKGLLPPGTPPLFEPPPYTPLKKTNEQSKVVPAVLIFLLIIIFSALILKEASVAWDIIQQMQGPHAEDVATEQALIPLG